MPLIAAAMLMSQMVMPSRVLLRYADDADTPMLSLFDAAAYDISIPLFIITLRHRVAYAIDGRSHVTHIV